MTYLGWVIGFVLLFLLVGVVVSVLPMTTLVHAILVLQSSMSLLIIYHAIITGAPRLRDRPEDYEESV